MTKGRIEALTDGIFAFAMTLLVTGMDLPGTQYGQVPGTASKVLANLYPDFVHYVIAFLTLAGFWYTHHVTYHHIRSMNARLLWINIVTLMFVALVPFSTSLAGDYPSDPLASSVLEANLLIIGLLFYWQWSYACMNRRLIEADVDSRVITQVKKRSLVVPAVSIVALALAFLNIRWSSAVYFVVPVILALVPHNARHKRST
jgi:uncharacterized membrane protein